MRIVVATSIAAAVLGCGFALQQMGLPRAGRGDVAAIRATTWLSRYRTSRSDVAVNGRWIEAICFRGWLGKRRGTQLRLSNGVVLLDIPPHTLHFIGRGMQRPVALMQAAGCTKVLGDRLAEDAEFDGGVRTHLVHINGASAFAVHFPRLTIYVSRHTGRPLGVGTPWFHSVFELGPRA